MENDLNKLFQNLGGVTVPAGLDRAVFARIDRETHRAARLRFAVFVPLALLSSVGVVVSFQYLAREIVQSGLSQYLSVIASDGGVVLAYWKEFSLSVAEQAPVFEIAIFLGTIVTLFGSLKAAVKNARTIFTHIQLA